MASLSFSRREFLVKKKNKGICVPCLGGDCNGRSDGVESISDGEAWSHSSLPGHSEHDDQVEQDDQQ